MSPAEIMLGRQPRTLIPAKTKSTMSNKYQNLRDRRREPIKKCYAEFENYVSLADTNFVKTRGKIVEKI